MKKRQLLFIIFSVCIIISLIIFGLAKRNGDSVFGMVAQFVFSPLQRASFNAVHTIQQKTLIDQLKEENMQLKTQLAKQELILRDNSALRDQFKTASPTSKILLPATIIGMPSFFPAVSFPEELILDKGEQDGVAVGNVVVYKDNLIGIITKINNHFSLVTVVGNKDTSFTAKTAKTNALGVIKGQGSGQMLFDNVVLSDTLQVGDIVVTSGDTTFTGQGYPPGLVFGKITSIEKNPSALFQKANVVSLVDITRVPTVFVIIREK